MLSRASLHDSVDIASGEEAFRIRFVNAVYVKEEAVVAELVDRISGEFAATMAMCGAYTLKESVEK